MIVFKLLNTLLTFYKAICPAGCFNGGNCTSPGMCTCPYGWTGNDCAQGMKCSFSSMCVCVLN